MARRLGSFPPPPRRGAGPGTAVVGGCLALVATVIVNLLFLAAAVGVVCLVLSAFGVI